MEFNQLISKKLHSLFTEHGLEITEQSKNIVKYESAILHVSLVHNPRENSNTFWLGLKHSNDFIEMDNQVIKKFFGSNLQLNNLPQETFVNNVFLFFISEGEEILQGNKSLLIDLENFNQARSEMYTTNLIDKQNLEAANKAWKDKNYSDVINYLEKVKKANLPASFKQKYKIAQQKLSN